MSFWILFMQKYISLITDRRWLGESRVASMAVSCFVASWVTAMLKWVKFKIKKNEFVQQTEPNKSREINLFVCICAQSVQMYM